MLEFFVQMQINTVGLRFQRILVAYSFFGELAGLGIMANFPYCFEEVIEAPALSWWVSLSLLSGFFLIPSFFAWCLLNGFGGITAILMSAYFILYFLAIIALAGFYTGRKSFPRILRFSGSQFSIIDPVRGEKVYKAELSYWYEGFVFNDYLLGLWFSDIYGLVEQFRFPDVIQRC